MTGRARAAATIDALLRERAATHGEVPFLRFVGGRDGTETFAAVDRRTDAVAAGLQTLGVGTGDLVAILMPNCSEFALTWFALARLGAVAAPINTAFRGRVLAHVVSLTAATVLVVDDSLLEIIGELRADRTGTGDGLGAVHTLVVRGDAAGAGPALAGLRIVRFDDVEQSGDPAGESAGRPDRHSGGRASDPAIVLFTSGTTGRSKGCVLSHGYVLRQAELMIANLQLRPDDVLFCPFPMFHLDAAVLTVAPALVLGTTAALAPRFSATQFWEQVRTVGATVFDFMGATLAILHKQPPDPRDADNPARLGWGVPLPDDTPQFEERFGVRLVELYGSTDAGLPIYTPLDEPRRLGTCGRAIPEYEVRLHDDDDHPVAVGQVGEIVVRPREPNLLMDGYLGMPEATVAATRNLWFHTGDLATMDADGFFTFVGRRKDAIRRRGENISAFEVEEIVAMHPSVLEVAAYGVASELSEQDVMISVVEMPGHALDHADLIRFCTERMASYMVPRYIEVVAELPKTPTEKVEKFVLESRGVTATTWDREANL